MSAQTDLAPERAFRNTLGCHATGVSVVTCLSAQGQPVGLTINSFSALSLAPQLILWSLREQSPLADCFVEGHPFTVHMLAADQQALARQFASPLADRFTGVRWHSGPHGAPRLAGALAVLDCRVWQRQRAGDHLLLIGEVLHHEATPAPPLLYLRGAFRQLASDCA